MGNKTINVDSLQRAAIKYQNILTTLPYYVLKDVCLQLGINIIKVEGTDKKTQFLRKGGLSKPYSTNTPIAQLYAGEIGKVIERKLTVEKCVLPLIEDINNYKNKNIISNASETVDNITKKHPLERLILESIIRTASEDILTSMFFGIRDERNLSPLGMFNGVHEIIDEDISAGNLAENLGNIIILGDNPFPTPGDTDDTTAWDNIKKFVLQLNPFLRKNGIIYIPFKVAINIKSALANALKYKNALAFEVLNEYLRGETDSPNLKISIHEVLGMGDRILAQKAGNMDLGLNTEAAIQFVQVRNPFEDPNLVQFWTQWDAGFRINSIHKKDFAVSDGISESDNTISGDYQSN